MTLPNPNVYATLDGLKTHPLWHQLTDAQRKFIEVLLSGASKMAAARAAYNVGSDNAASALASKLMRHVEIRTLLSAHWGYPLLASHVSKRELCSLISMKLRAAKESDSSLSEMRHLSSIYAELKGWRRVPRRVKDKQSGSEDEAVRPLESRNELMKLVKQYEREQGHDEGSEEEDEG